MVRIVSRLVKAFQKFQNTLESEVQETGELVTWEVNILCFPVGSPNLGRMGSFGSAPPARLPVIIGVLGTYK